VAISSPSAPIKSITGRAGPITYQHSRLRTVIHASTKTTTPRAISQRPQQARYAAAISQWRALPYPTQLAWKHAARNIPIPAGQSKQPYLSGWQAFFSISLWQRSFAETNPPSPPLAQTSAACSALSLSLSTTPFYTAEWSFAGTPTPVSVLIHAQPLWSKAASPKTRQWRFIYLGLWKIPGDEFTTEWLQIFPPLQNGQRAAVRARFWSPGYWPSPWTVAVAAAS